MSLDGQSEVYPFHSQERKITYEMTNLSLFSVLIIHMEKLLDSDWLKVVHHCKLHIVILDYDLQTENGKFCRPMIL